jgi:hypothetical protein
MSYSKEMEAVLRSASPLTFEKAQDIASQDAFQAAGKSQRSVIAKAKSMGIDYIPKAKPVKRATEETKSDLVDRIAVALGGDSSDFAGLSKATTAALLAVLSAVTPN